jgi:hypothetical protein
MNGILVEVDYKKYQWEVCGEFKVIMVLLGLQTGYTKYSCSLCERDSCTRDTHSSRKHWPHRQSLTPGLKNVIYKPMIKPSKVLPPPLHGQAKGHVVKVSNFLFIFIIHITMIVLLS